MDFGLMQREIQVLIPRDSGPSTHIAQLDVPVRTHILRLSERKIKAHLDRF